MRIVVVEDNTILAQAIAYRLRDRGHSADVLTDGEEADAFLAQEGADLVVLDINLPGMSGLKIIEAMRRRGSETPVILLTAQTGTKDKVTGLDLGADDYLVKPFEMDELEARIRALLRRKKQGYGATEAVGALAFNRTTRQFLSDNTVLDLPRKELAILECLAENRGRIISKSQIVDHVYGVGAEVDDTVIEPHISRLRRRVQDYGLRIKTARGLGYVLEVLP
ncbi:MAG: response regulator transcription factor [Rhodospirillaceae bacterium]